MPLYPHSGSGSVHGKVNQKNSKNEIVFKRLWYPLSILLLDAIGVTFVDPHGGIYVNKEAVTEVTRSVDWPIWWIRKMVYLTENYIKWCKQDTNSKPDPPENCHLTVKKLPKTYFFQKKLTKIFIFLNKIANGIFVEKMSIFVNCFEKNVKFLVIFDMAIFWRVRKNLQFACMTI